MTNLGPTSVNLICGNGVHKRELVCNPPVVDVLGTEFPKYPILVQEKCPNSEQLLLPWIQSTNNRRSDMAAIPKNKNE